MYIVHHDTVSAKQRDCPGMIPCHRIVLRPDTKPRAREMQGLRMVYGERIANNEINQLLHLYGMCPSAD